MAATAKARKKPKTAVRASPSTRLTTRPARREASTVRATFGLTRKLLARMTGLSERTLASWEAGNAVGPSALRAVTAVERLLAALTEVVRRDGIPAWLEQPNDAYGGLKPVEVMERGETDRLWRMIYFLGSGTAS